MESDVKVFSFAAGRVPPVESIWQMPGSFSFTRVLAVADFTGDGYDDLLLETQFGDEEDPRVQLWTGKLHINRGLVDTVPAR